MKDNLAVGLLIDEFLAAQKVSGAPRTFDYYDRYLSDFRTVAGGLRVKDVTNTLVYKWIDKRYGRLAPSSQWAAARCSTRLFNWAVNERRITQTPLVGFRKPAPTHREVVITPAQYVACIKHGREMRDVVKFLWHAGPRPQELRAIQASWIQGRKIVFPQLQSKGERARKRKRRVIYLDGMATGIVTRLSQAHPRGPVFRNTKGKPWSSYSLVSAFERLENRTKIAPLFAYAFRHTWITRMLERGVDVATVAALAGTSVQMIINVYQHVIQNESRLLSLFD